MKNVIIDEDELYPRYHITIVKNLRRKYGFITISDEDWERFEIIEDAFFKMQGELEILGREQEKKRLAQLRMKRRKPK